MNGFHTSSPQTSSQTGKKVLTIKPFKQQPKLSENYEITAWTQLEKALNAVYSKTSLEGISKEELYRIVEDLCMHKKGPELYEKLSLNCKEFVRKRIENVVTESISKDLISFLTVVDNMWQDHCEVMTTVRNIFIYLDRSYALSNYFVKNVWDLGLEYMKLFLEEKPEIETKLIMGLLASIEADRQGHMIDTDQIQRLLRMFLSLGIYKDKFENPMLIDSKRFFSSEGRYILESLDVAQFLEHTDKRILEVKDMVNRYLDSSTRQPLIHIVEQYLFAPHISVLLERGLYGLLDSDRIGDLKRFYGLLERVGQLNELKAGWIAYIRKVGEAYVQEDEKREKTLIDDLLLLQDRSDTILKQAFNTHDSFKQAFKSSMVSVVNLKVNRVAELLARYIDRKLRGEKGMQENDTEQSFDKVISLFKLIQGKDVFEAFYKKLLAKRLLLGKSASYELEKSMLSRLKTECGSGFTSKLDGMFQDIDLSRDTMNTYAIAVSKTPVSASEPETSIQVLTTGFWPSCPPTDTLVVPNIPFGPIMRRFENFYRDKYNGRRLAWTHALGRCIVVARFNRGTVKKELEVSFFQALVLLCFKDLTTDNLTLEHIRSFTGLEDAELRRTLQSLACGALGTRVLTKNPRGRDINDDDNFFVNEEFNNKLYRIKINTIQLKETVEEVEKTHEEIFRERLYQVDAAIVRIMKTRKRLQHNILMSELLSQLKFPARVTDIKQRIESLIERDYLERDRDDSSYYSYRA